MWRHDSFWFDQGWNHALAGCWYPPLSRSRISLRDYRNGFRAGRKALLRLLYEPKP